MSVRSGIDNWESKLKERNLVSAAGRLIDLRAVFETSFS